MARTESSLSERSLHALMWNYIGVAVRITSQLIAQISLARLLGPEPFGIYAIAFLVAGPAGIIIEMGLGSALIQKREICDKDIRLAYTRIIMTSLIVAIAVYFLSSIPASFFGNGQVTSVLRWMIPAFVLQALGVVPFALLRRDLNFRALQITQLIAYLVGYIGVGISSALVGAGVWSLVAATTTTNMITLIIGYLLTRPPIFPFLITTDTLLPRFGAKVALINVSNWIVENIDNLVVGKLFGAEALGLYSICYSLVRAPTNHLVVAFQAVLFPASARAYDNPELLRHGYLVVISAVTIIAFPMFIGIAAIGNTMIDALFGSHWINASGILAPLSLAMMFHASMAVAGPILWGTGRPGAELKIQAWMALLLAAVLLISSQFSLTVLAWGVFAVYGLRAIWMTKVLMQGIYIPLGHLSQALRGGLLLATAILPILAVEDYLLQGTGKPATYRLSVEIISASVTWMSLLLAAPNKMLSRELAQVIQRIIVQTSFLDHSQLLRRIQAAHRNIST